MRSTVWVTAVLVLGLASCSSSQPQVKPTGQLSRTCDPTGSTAAPHVSGKDLADFIYHDNAYYYAVVGGSSAPQVREQLGRVSCTLTGSSTPLAFDTPREGLAGSVTEGTAYFAIAACSSADAIAAEEGKQLRVFLRQRPTNEAPAVRDALERKCTGAAGR
jgi:hypothetical protein